VFSPAGWPHSGPMKRLLIATFIALWPVAANAQELTPDQVRATFTSAGYTADAPLPFADGVQTIAVHDGAETPGWPTLRAFVFADAAAAEQAHRADQLLAGYGAPLWNGNVALIQVSKNPAAFPQEPTCAPVLESPAPVVLDAVDPTFSGVLSRGGDL
jgi:hypothetical protein